MNKVLLIGVSVLGLFLSSEAYCAYCSTCCASAETVFCPHSDSSEECTAGCDCCDEETHSIVESSKKGYWNCCNKKTEEIYWNGSAALCCDGKKYKNGADTEECCTGDKATNPTQKKVAVSGAPITGLETCCSISTYGPNPTAYWDGSSAVCCKGQAYKDGDTWYCCDGKRVEAFNSSGVYSCCPNIDEKYTGDVTAYTSQDGGDFAECCYGQPYISSFDGSKNVYSCCGLTEWEFYDFEWMYQDEENPTAIDYIENHDVCGVKGWSKIQGCCMNGESGIFTNANGLSASCCSAGREYMDFEYEHLWGVSGYSSPTSYKIESSWKCCEDGKSFHSTYKGPEYDPQPNQEVEIAQTEMCCNSGEVAYRSTNDSYMLNCCAGTPYFEQDVLLYYGKDFFPDDGYYHRKHWSCCETGKILVPSTCVNGDGVKYEQYCCPKGSTAHGYHDSSYCTCY